MLEALTEINRTTNLLEPQLQHYMNSCILWLKEFFEFFPIAKYEPVLGRIQPTISIENVNIEMDISGVFRSKDNQTIHAITFAPSSSKHSVLNLSLIHI